MALLENHKDDQIEYDSEMNPVGVSGDHTPSPPFHWIVGQEQPLSSET